MPVLSLCSGWLFRPWTTTESPTAYSVPGSTSAAAAASGAGAAASGAGAGAAAAGAAAAAFFGAAAADALPFFANQAESAS